MKNFKIVGLVVGLCCGVLNGFCVTSAKAVAGGLDATFGTGGSVVTTVGDDTATGQAVQIQPDGKIVVGGSALNGANRDWFLLRYNPNGTLDTSFGNGGKVFTDISGGNDTLTDLALQSDGKIVAVGNSFDVARFNANGSLDATFDSDGKITVAGGLNVNAVAIDANGKIAIVGSQPVAAGYNSYGYLTTIVVRLNDNGSLDTSFNTTGKVTYGGYGYPDFAANAYGRAITIQADGKIIAVGIQSGVTLLPI